MGQSKYLYLDLDVFPTEDHMSVCGKRFRGFTLVELLVVIGIIAVLISILLPSLSKARSSAKSIQCQANLRTIGQAIQIYVGQNKGILPYGYWDYQPVPGSHVYYNWGTLLMNAMDPKLVTDSNNAVAGGTNTSKIRSALLCPEVPSDGVDRLQLGVLHYLTHPRLMPALDMIDPSDTASPKTKTLKPYKIAHIQRSQEIALIFDGSLVPTNSGSSQYYAPIYQIPVAIGLDSGRMWWSDGGMTDNYNVDNDSGLTDRNTPIDLTPQPYNSNKDFNKDNSNNWYNIRFRHRQNNATNVLFVDGHVADFVIKGIRQSELKRYNFYVNP